MNLEFFIARKVAGTGSNGFSRIIINIAIAAIALSMTVMICATALIHGFKKEITSKIFGFWGHIHVNDINLNNTFESIPVDKDQTFYPGLDSIGRVEYSGKPMYYNFIGGEGIKMKSSKGGIDHIQIFALKEGIIKNEKPEGIILKGVWDDFKWDFLEQYFKAGRKINFPDSTMSRDILISRSTANRLEIDVDDQLTIFFVRNNQQLQRRFKVCGIYQTGLEEYDKRFALVDIRQIQKLQDWSNDQVSGFEVFLDDLDDLNVFHAYINEEILPTKLYAETIRYKFPGIFEWLELQNINEVVIISLMLIVSIINMITALMILILERTNMIGTLKALGHSDWGIRRIFLYYAAYIVVIGLLLGNLIGISICFLQKKFSIIKLREEDYYLDVAPIDLDFWTIMLLNFGTLLITLIFLLIPSYLVTKISPLKAIRFK